jgi:hypothetical protein
MVKQNVLRLQVVMNDFLLLIVQILQTAEYLRNDEFCLLFWNLLVLLKVAVKVGSAAMLKDRTEAIVINFNRVELFHNPPVDQVFMNFIFSEGMLNVVLFDCFIPCVIEMVDLAGDLPAVFEVEGLIDF